MVEIEFDPDKDALNVAKHGVSLSWAVDLQVLANFEDRRFGEPRFRAYGLIEGVRYCLAYTLREGRLRAISLRRARIKEFKRHGL